MITIQEARKEAEIQFDRMEYNRNIYNGMTSAERATENGWYIYKSYQLAKKRFEYYIDIANR